MAPSEDDEVVVDEDGIGLAVEAGRSAGRRAGKGMNAGKGGDRGGT